MYPRISCLCPTFGRPRLLANAVACFLAQDYPPDRCKLIVLDDLGNLLPHLKCGVEDRYRIFTQKERCNSLPEKYNTLVSLAPVSDIYVVWEDDDVQFPWCLSSHALACEHHAWSYPSEVWSDYTGALATEHTGGRFHGCLAITREALRLIGGWPLTLRADFDQHLISTLRQQSGQPGDPLKFSPDCPASLRSHSGKSPGYLFRWRHDQAHGQAYMRGPEDEGWYDRYIPPDNSGPHQIIPSFDVQTIEFYRQMGFAVG